MVKNGLDKFKQITLKRLKEKEPLDPIYPIAKKDLLIIKKCPLCSRPDFTTISEVYLESGLLFFTTSVCNYCGLTFRPISPSLSWFKKCWNQIKSDKLEVFNIPTEKYRIRRYKKYCSIFSKYIIGGKALDIGSGYGSGADVLRQNKFLVEAIEPEPNKANYIQKAQKIRVVGNEIEKFINKNKYDLVMFSNCLEHLDDPVKIMSKVKNLLADDQSILFLAVPIIWDYVTWTDALYLTHKTNFTREHIMHLAARNNLELLEMGPVSYYFPGDKSFEYIFVLKKSSHSISLDLSLKSPKQNIINAVKKLYRTNLPFKTDGHSVLRYQVPSIEQFFQTVILSNKEVVPPRETGGYIRIMKA